MEDPLETIINFFADVKLFFRELTRYVVRVSHIQFIKFEEKKGFFVTSLYRQRGKMAGRFIHSGMAGLAAVGIMIAPVVAQEFPGKSVDPWSVDSPSSVLSASTTNEDTSTNIANPELRERIVDYTVQPGDTVSSIAQKFGVSEDTIRWQNDLVSKDSIKEGEILEILPVTGVSYKVQKGDTVNSIAKKFAGSGASNETIQGTAQGILDFPFNTFANDETYELAIGQTVIVPNGVKQSDVFWSPIASVVTRITPDAGSVSGTGQFVWPTQGVITQYFAWYHPGVDIANNAAPAVLAADSGTVAYAGWDGSGYGNKIMISHGNGYTTLYGHLSRIYVGVGQGVTRGAAIGQMGSSGRSTGTHLHFEIYTPGGRVNPLSLLGR